MVDGNKIRTVIGGDLLSRFLFHKAKLAMEMHCRKSKWSRILSFLGQCDDHQGRAQNFLPLYQNKMRFLVSADETGNVKEVICSSGTDTSQKDALQPELIRSVLEDSDRLTVKTRIRLMRIMKDNVLLAARIGGYVDFYDVSDRSSDNFGKLLRSVGLGCEKGAKPIALELNESLGIAMVALESSDLYIISINEADSAPITIKLPGRTPEATSISAFTSNAARPGVFAYGGKDNDLQIIKLYDENQVKKKGFKFADAGSWKPKVLFKAENVEPDHLGLDVPIWVTGILFQKSTGSKHFKLVTSTWYGHIRKYDTLSDEEPIASYKVCEKPITNLRFATDSEEDIIITDTHTYVAKLSLIKVDAKAVRIVSASAGTFYRPSLKVLGRYSQGGNTGAINSVEHSPASEIVATGGLDRYLRVFDVKTRNLLAKVYVGTQISSIVFIEDDSLLNSEKEAAEIEQQQEDELWEQLEDKKEVDDKPLITKKRRRI